VIESEIVIVIVIVTADPRVATAAAAVVEATVTTTTAAEGDHRRPGTNDPRDVAVAVEVEAVHEVEVEAGPMNPQTVIAILETAIGIQHTKARAVVAAVVAV